MTLSTYAARRRLLAIEFTLSTSAISNSWLRIWQTASVPLRFFLIVDGTPPSADPDGTEVWVLIHGAGGQNRTGYARLFRAALYQ